MGLRGMGCLFRAVFTYWNIHAGGRFLSIRYFDANGRSLLAAVHLPSRLRPRSAAVLLCNPFGEEAVRAHRAYRVMARKFEEAGYATMRFDYAGTGDSSGDVGEFGIADWSQDIVAASAELRRESGIPRVVLVGLRLGATLAACAQREGLRAAHLLLWDPVVDGAQYLRELGDAHRAYMAAELGRTFAAGEAEALPTESLGTPLDEHLRNGLQAIDLVRVLTGTSSAAANITVLCTQRNAGMDRLKADWAERARAHWIDLDSSAAWNSDAALNDAIVPMNEIIAIVSRIETCHP
jgi:uncharacterized protein